MRHNAAERTSKTVVKKLLILQFIDA